MSTYRYSRVSRILYYIIGVPVSIGLLITPLLIWILSVKFNPVLFIFLGGMTFLMGGYFFRGIFEMAKGQLTIRPDLISYKAIWKTNTLPMSDVLGYRVVESRLQIIPKKGSRKKKIVINKYFENYAQIELLITQTMSNIDEVEARHELTQVISDSNYGPDEEARIARLKKAKRVSSIVNLAGIGIAAWVGFSPTYNMLVTILAMALPVIIIFIAYPFKGLITISERTNSKIPTMMYGFLFVCLTLMIRGFLDYNLLTYSSQFWINCCGLTIVVLILLMAVDRDFRPAFKSTFFGLLLAYTLLVFSYSIGTITILNCAFDQTTPSIKNTTVISKKAEIIKVVANFKVTVAAWHEVKGSNEISVTRKEFQTINPGDTIGVALHPGLLGVAWYHAVLK